MGNVSYPPAVKAKVMADVLVYGATETSKRNGVSLKTIQRWTEEEGVFPHIFIKQAESLLLKVAARLHEAIDAMDVSDPKAVMALLAIGKIMGEMSLHYDDIQTAKEGEEEGEEEEAIYIEV